jgi:signal transduction histidine kinase
MSKESPDFRLLFEESPDLLLVFLPDSPRFTAVAATKARLQSTHSSAEEIIGRALFELFPDTPDDPGAHASANLRASLERVLATRAADTLAVQKCDIPLPGGGYEVQYWSQRNTPILAEDGRVAYILHRAVDVTDLERAGEANARLRELDRKWGADLQMANRELDTFSYSVAHDLRGPLRAIDGFSAMLLQDHARHLDDDGRRLLDVVRSSATRMSRLIDDLLSLSRVSRGDVRRIPFDLSSVVRTVALQIEAVEPGRTVALSLQPGVMVDADPHMLQIVLDNLLRNAWKFTSKRSDAAVEFGSATANGEAFYFVRDNGAGFNMDYAEKLFGVFQRLHPESEFPGTGIGLATVKRIIGRHEGRVWAHSAPGQGATFYFTLGPEAAAPAPGQSSAVA